MLISKRAIPRIATTGLVLGGAACSSSSDPTPSSIARDYCFGFSECDPYDFDATYVSIDECIDVNFYWYDQQAEGWAFSVGGACADAFLDYYGCFWDESRATCDSFYAEDVCAGLYNRFYDLCGLYYL